MCSLAAQSPKPLNPKPNLAPCCDGLILDKQPRIVRALVLDPLLAQRVWGLSFSGLGLRV